MPEWVAGTIQPILQLAVELDGIEADKLFIDYPNLSRGTGYVSPTVMLEFGVRSTGEPASPRDIVCGAAPAGEGARRPFVKIWRQA